MHARVQLRTRTEARASLAEGSVLCGRLLRSGRLEAGGANSCIPRQTPSQYATLSPLLFPVGWASTARSCQRLRQVRPACGPQQSLADRPSSFGSRPTMSFAEAPSPRIRCVPCVPFRWPAPPLDQTRHRARLQKGRARTWTAPAPATSTYVRLFSFGRAYSL